MMTLRLEAWTVKRLRQVAETEKVPLDDVVATVLVLGLDCLEKFRCAKEGENDGRRSGAID